jgi:ParB/RepB/Spo0J family partition protein
MAYYKKNPFEVPDFTEKKKGNITREIKIGVIDEDSKNDEIYNEDKHALEDLINDIDSVGLITPLTVRRNQRLSDRYILIAGHRRLKALKSLGHKTVPCLVVTTETEEDCLKADVMHLTSNIMTRDRSILERTKEAKLLKERIIALKKIDPNAYKGKTDGIVAKMMNVSSSYVRQLVRIENADDDIKKKLADEVIGIADALKLQGMDLDKKKEVAEKIRNASDDTSKRETAVKALEQKIDEHIRSDLAKLEKLVVHLVSNIAKSKRSYTDEIDNAISRLQ